MKFTRQAIFAIAAGVFNDMTLASPHALNVRDVQRQPMTPADRLSVSGLDYMTWANKMVAEGKMYWPSNSTKREIQTRSTTYTVKNVVCGFVGGTDPLFTEGQQKFCALANQYAGLTLQGVEYILNDGLCQNNEECTLILNIAFGVGGGFASDAVNDVCASLFFAVYDECNNSVGGAADITVTDSEGTQSGTIEGQFFAEDDSASCPANSDTFQCASSLF